MKGSFTFEDEFCPTKETYKLLGAEGFEYLINKFKSLITARIEMFGDEKVEYYGFQNDQRFTHLPTLADIHIQANSHSKYIHEGDLEFPHLLKANTVNLVSLNNWQERNALEWAEKKGLFERRLKWIKNGKHADKVRY